MGVHKGGVFFFFFLGPYERDLGVKGIAVGL